MPTPALTMEFEVHFPHDGERRRAKPGRKPTPKPVEEQRPAKLPRVVRMLALAHHLDRLVREGLFADYADIARVSGLTRARVTQIMGLLLLAPEIQKRLLNTPETAHAVTERMLQQVVREVEWDRQTKLWEAMMTI